MTTSATEAIANARCQVAATCVAEPPPDSNSPRPLVWPTIVFHVWWNALPITGKR